MSYVGFLAVGGGAAFRAIAGFGRHGIIHEQQFFELAGDLTIEVEFVVSREQAERMLELVRSERIRIFYAVIPAEFGSID